MQLTRTDYDYDPRTRHMTDNENNMSRKKVVQKLAFWRNKNPESVEK